MYVLEEETLSFAPKKDLLIRSMLMMF